MLKRAFLPRVFGGFAFKGVAFLAVVCLFYGVALRADVMLLSKFDPKKFENGSLEAYLVSEKLDGVRAFWDGKELKSRTNKSFFAPKCFTKNFPPFALDGELFIARGKFEETLSVVSSQNSSCEAWKKVGYFVFDTPNAKGGLLARLSVAQKWLDAAPNGQKPPIVIIEQIRLSTLAQLQEELQKVTKLGGEGLVVRKEDAPYEAFRTKNAMKLKLYEDAECKVVAHHEGKGKFKGVLGAVECEEIGVSSAQIAATTGRDALAKRAKRFKIGSGFSDYDRANPPPIGSLITYKFHGYTKNGVPKFPSFLRLYRAM